MRLRVQPDIDGAIMRIRLLLVAAATLALAACGESSTAPHQLRAGARAADDVLTCRSGYHIATRADGSQFCEPDDGTILLGGTSSTSASGPRARPDSL